MMKEDGEEPVRVIVSWPQTVMMKLMLVKEAEEMKALI